MLFPSFKKEHDGVSGSGGFTYIISLELFIIMTWENACLPFVEKLTPPLTSLCHSFHPPFFLSPHKMNASLIISQRNYIKVYLLYLLFAIYIFFWSQCHNKTTIIITLIQMQKIGAYKSFVIPRE